MLKLSFPGNGFDSQYIHSIMVYPNNESAQERLIASNGISHLVENAQKNKISISVELLKLLNNSNTQSAESCKASLQAAKGEIAGDVLINLAKMKLSGYIEPSLGKANRLTMRKLANAKNTENKSAPASEPKIKQIYKEFSSVTHLWAAYNICQDPSTTNYIRDFNIHESANMVKFLSIANWFRNFAETFASTRQPIKSEQKYLIGANDIYQLDNTYNIIDPEVTWQKMDNSMLEELNSYNSSI